jgi:hypothetical protein
MRERLANGQTSDGGDWRRLVLRKLSCCDTVDGVSVDDARAGSLAGRKAEQMRFKAHVRPAWNSVVKVESRLIEKDAASSCCERTAGI